MASIIFDSMGAQVQVQFQTADRLTTWVGALETNFEIAYTQIDQPIAPQLEGHDVFIITTHQRADVPPGSTPPAVFPNPVPAAASYSYPAPDLGGILAWVQNGGGLLLFVNHTNFAETPPPDPYWPINDIQLAAALGITTVFAAIGLKGLTMYPNPDAPAAIISGVGTVEAWDSGGIVLNPAGVPAIVSNQIVLVPLPVDAENDPLWQDKGPLGYGAANLAFAVLYEIGQGKVIVIGHSGVCGNAGTDYPSQGQIGAADNLTFLSNCVGYLAGAAGQT
jgi:hypothetical protein